MSKKLYRSGKHKILGGVAGGIAEYFNVDPVLVRVIFIVTLFTFGISLFVYIALWMVIPERPLEVILGMDKEAEDDREFISSFETGNQFSSKSKKFGIILVAVGAIVILDNMFSVISSELFWSLAMISIGGYFIMKNR